MLSLLCEADPPAAINANALGTFHVLEAARLFAVPQVLFASSIGTYRDDWAMGRSMTRRCSARYLLYGATKLFGELLGRFYRRKYGLDFRGLRYPVIVAPGVTTPGVLQYTSWVIEAAANGIPFTITVEPGTGPAVLYVKDAARAMVELAAAPEEQIRTINYLVTGTQPAPTAGELVDLIRGRVPAAQIDFAPDPECKRWSASWDAQSTIATRVPNGAGSRPTGWRRWSMTSYKSCASIPSDTPRDCRTAQVRSRVINLHPFGR